MQSTTDPALSGTGLYSEIQQFYAHQMQLLDSGETDAWADTFTEDGVFAANAHPDAKGRETIREAAGKAAAQRIGAGLQVRHWLGMLEVAAQEDGSARVRSYALVLNTPAGGAPAVHASTTCDDLLVRGEDGAWLVAHRYISRDDLR
ncbi:nuclear transport factor 2 family protein [Kitasatospora sp. NBC_00315]|uniref:nuclear transport factor 2 family protein n=1 Tax=Kitasatospora sp. NBC_00315 TaxID=2975963 RepID=UPI00324BA5BC